MKLTSLKYHSLPLPFFSPTSSFPFVSFPLPCSPQTCRNETKQKEHWGEGKEWEKVNTSLLLCWDQVPFALAGRLASFMPYSTCLGMALPLAHFLFLLTLEGSFKSGPWTIWWGPQIHIALTSSLCVIRFPFHLASNKWRERKAGNCERSQFLY